MTDIDSGWPCDWLWPIIYQHTWSNCRVNKCWGCPLEIIPLGLQPPCIEEDGPELTVRGRGPGCGERGAADHKWAPRFQTWNKIFHRHEWVVLDFQPQLNTQLNAWETPAETTWRTYPLAHGIITNYKLLLFLATKFWSALLWSNRKLKHHVED